MRHALLVAAVLFSTSLAFGQGVNPMDIPAFTGNDFLANCPADAAHLGPNTTGAALLQAVACTMYIRGMADGLQAMFVAEKGWNAQDDFTSRRTVSQIYDIVRQYIVNHPADRDKVLPLLVPGALLDSVKGRQ